MQFPAKKNAVAQKHRAISRQVKMAFSTPGRVVLGLPSPSPRVTIGYQICLAIELRWRALPAGCAIKFSYLPTTEKGARSRRNFRKRKQIG